MRNYPSSFNPFSAFGYAMQHYADFKGRARRQEFWMFQLLLCIGAFIFGFITALIVPMSLIATGDVRQMFSNSIGLLFLFAIFVLALIIPTYALFCRRLHDIGMSGWWLLFMLVPNILGEFDSTGFISILGTIAEIVFIVLACFDSKPGINKYGPNPKGFGNYTHQPAGYQQQPYGQSVYPQQPGYPMQGQQPGYPQQPQQQIPPPQTFVQPGFPPPRQYGAPTPPPPAAPPQNLGYDSLSTPSESAPPAQPTPPQPEKPKSQSWEDDPSLYL
ncbi:MAG: DUF805 domain-containing protein [Ruminococcus sp.]|jgi:uncharacterized membrane protein YhaH (DUF805 family)|nr:DUF805 domain-containing protein [Ruminococcus sp.]